MKVPEFVRWQPGLPGSQPGAFTAKLLWNAPLCCLLDDQKINLMANRICRSGIVVLVSKPAPPLSVPSAKKMSLLSGTVGGDIFLSDGRSEENTSELQSRSDLVCRLLLE